MTKAVQNLKKRTNIPKEKKHILSANKTKTIQIRKKGTLTLPVDLRKRYELDEGDPVTLIDLEEGIFISPKRLVLPKLVDQIEKMRLENNITLSELIEGVKTLRKQKS